MEFLKRQCRGATAAGFTLVELLAVIALITGLMGLLGYAVLSAGSVSMEGAERLAGAQFAQARKHALRGRSPVRVLIPANTVDEERYLRELSLVRRRGDEWELIGEASTLPRGYYFLPERSLDHGSQAPETMVLESRAGVDGRYYYFEYDGRGECRQSGAQFVIEPGRLGGTDGNWQVIPASPDTETQHETRGGFVLLRLGGLLYFPDPESIR